jgi:hypothetical protein
VIPSKSEFPEYQVTAATVEEVGEENAQWLRPDFVAVWQAADETDGVSSQQKGKGKAKSESSEHTLSKQYESRWTYDLAHASNSGGNEEFAGFSQYSIDPDTRLLYRYADNGALVYWDPTAQREYYYDEQGRVVWF